MKRYFGIIATVGIVLLVLIALNAAGTITLDRPPEDEYLPIRSSYSAGPTGTRAFYQLLEESGYRVMRWRENYKDLNLPGSNAKGASLIIVGPFPLGIFTGKDEDEELKKWVANGGRLLIVSRSPQGQFDDAAIFSSTKQTGYDLKDAPVEKLIEPNTDTLISQPTSLTQNVRGLAISKLATRLTFRLPSEDIKTSKENEKESPTPKPTPSPAVDNNENPEERDNKKASVPEAKTDEVEPQGSLIAPIIHLGDSEGAVLAEFEYGKGHLFFLSDPFVLANNGLAQGSNLFLALNLIEALGGSNRKIFFDEYHHGYHSQGNAMMNYFRGTPLPWLFFQFLIVALLLAYSYGKRFARPLPVPIPDRHSPLEFVGSMASLQQMAHARDLALENIYPRFRIRLCRTLGLPTTAPPQAILTRLKRRSGIRESEVELMRIFTESERALKGEKIDDQRLIDLVAAMRRLSAQLKS